MNPRSTLHIIWIFVTKSSSNCQFIYGLYTHNTYNIEKSEKADDGVW